LPCKLVKDFFADLDGGGFDVTYANGVTQSFDELATATSFDCNWVRGVIDDVPFLINLSQVNFVTPN
jgi:hypothetical protein